MELVTASDLVVTASLALLLSFLVAKLVSFAIPTDPHTTNHVNNLRHVSADRFTVQTAQSESKVEFQLATNIETEHNTDKEEEEEEEEQETTVESSNVVDLSVTSMKVSEVDPQAVGSDNDSAEQRKTDRVFVEEISSVEQESSVVEERDVAVDDDDDDDDWEGIERSELEKVFMAATEFVVGNDGSERDGLGNDVEMELYGLHKVATEGPCRQPQPMPLKLSARAKWNAWQKLGNMSPEVAMEHYISIVSDKVPGWMKDTSAGMSEDAPAGSEISESVAADLSTSLSHQQLILTDREIEQEKESSAQDRSPLTESDLENNVKK